MENLNITSAQYVNDPDNPERIDNIKCIVDGISIFVPLDPANRHYAEIMRQVEDGSLVISPAEGEQ